MLVWALVISWAALAVVAVLWSNDRSRCHWYEVSVEGRLRDQGTQIVALKGTLGRLRSAVAEGQLTPSPEYAGTFERLTAEGRSSE